MRLHNQWYMTTSESDQQQQIHTQHCSNIPVPTVGESTLMRPLTSSMDGLFHHASRFLFAYIIHVDTVWMPLMSQLNVIPLLPHHCEKHSRSDPSAPFQGHGNVALLCMTNASVYSIYDPARWSIGCRDLSQFTTALPFLLLLCISYPRSLGVIYIEKNRFYLIG